MEHWAENKIRKNYKSEVLINNSSRRNQFSPKMLNVDEEALAKRTKNISQIYVRKIWRRE